MQKKVVIGMSGGVDSAVSAYILKEQGYEVVGLFMRNWKEQDNGLCTAEEDYHDVRRVCDKIGIPYYSVDFSKEYMDRVFKLFVQEYKAGRTPNPDVLCNSEIKFESFRKYALKTGADYIATGHYADLEVRDGKNYLKRAVDDNKDQTYFLNQLSNEQLNNVMFPLGGLSKPEVREIAKKYDIPNATKKDSTGICFIGERNFRNFLKDYIPMKEGIIKSIDGRVVGKHQGVYYYTAGQRKGLGIGGSDTGNGKPWFVVGKDVKENILYVSQGECEEMYSDVLEFDKFNFIPGDEYAEEFDCLCRIRHRQPLQKAKFIKKENKFVIKFEKKQRAMVEGQYAVIYDKQYCLGGGKIEKVKTFK